MPGRFEGLNDLEWKLFQDIFPKTEKKRSRGMPHHSTKEYTSLCVVVGN